MKNHLLISILGIDRPALINDLSRTILDAGCTVLDCRLVTFGDELGGILHVKGNWNTLVKLEKQLERFESTPDLTFAIKRIENQRPVVSLLPYAIEVIAPENPALLSELSQFFVRRTVSIEEMSIRSYSAPYTGTAMCAVSMTLGLPANTHIALLREEFMDFCDEFNFDAILEPIKG